MGKSIDNSFPLGKCDIFEKWVKFVNYNECFLGKNSVHSIKDLKIIKVRLLTVVYDLWIIKIQNVNTYFNVERNKNNVG